MAKLVVKQSAKAHGPLVLWMAFIFGIGLPYAITHTESDLGCRRLLVDLRKKCKKKIL